MRTVSVASAKAHLSELLDSVEAGASVVITRHSRAIATLVPAEKSKQALPLARLAKVRGQVAPWTRRSVDLLKALRDAE